MDACLSDLVATVLTVYGIETVLYLYGSRPLRGLQQYLPFTVLKRNANIIKRNTRTVPGCNSTYRLRY